MGAWQGPLVQDLLGRWATTHSTVSPSCDLKVMDGMGGGGGGEAGEICSTFFLPLPT